MRAPPTEYGPSEKDGAWTQRVLHTGIYGQLVVASCGLRRASSEEGEAEVLCLARCEVLDLQAQVIVTDGPWQGSHWAFSRARHDAHSA